ncbi:hypothetical protein G9A89_022754 [Geosiphon pyriformis]|nr:hypothetical protein G9A89_022754 [Geosiphon pyriformis]
MEITDNIYSLAQQLFQLIQHQEMEITINQQTIRYQDTRKTFQLRTQKKTENTVDKIMTKIAYQKGTTARINPAAKLRKKLGIIATPGKLLPSPLNLCLLYKKLHNKTFRSTKTFRYHTFHTSSTKVAFEYQVTDLLFNTTTKIITCNNGEYFERFKLQSLTPSGIQLLPLQPDFGTATL